MFTQPPQPPKDYVIKDVTFSLQSSPQFTVGSLPRVTQTNLAKFCSPIEYKDDEPPQKTEVPEFEPIIMEKMMNDARATWVFSPGIDDFFVHDVYRKYSQPPLNYDPRFRNMEKVFNRSYQYELDCVEERRLEKLRAKSRAENAEFENKFQKLVEKQKEKEPPAIQVQACRNEPPFWWKGGEEEMIIKNGAKQPLSAPATSVDLGSTTYQTSYARWIEEPNLTAFVQDDPCRRKYEMHLQVFLS